METKYPNVKVTLVGRDGNAFYILGAVSKALRNAGLHDAAETYLDEAQSGDYDHLLHVSMSYVEVS
jgi:hypothetical protein